MSDETVTVAIDIKEITTQADGINTTDIFTGNNQTVTVENTTQAPELTPIEMCNETYPTSKGTVEIYVIKKLPMVKCEKFVIEIDNYLACLNFVFDDSSPPF